jgi:hypothetical protein
MCKKEAKKGLAMKMEGGPRKSGFGPVYFLDYISIVSCTSETVNLLKTTKRKPEKRPSHGSYRKSSPLQQDVKVVNRIINLDCLPVETGFVILIFRLSNHDHPISTNQKYHKDSRQAM